MKRCSASDLDVFNSTFQHVHITTNASSMVDCVIATNPETSVIGSTLTLTKSTAMHQFHKNANAANYITLIEAETVMMVRRD